MSFTDGTQAENEAQAASRDSRLVRVRYDAGVEQRRCFKRILMHEIGANELALNFGKRTVRRERLLHFVGPGFKRLQQVAVPALEVLKNIIELAGRGLRIELENTLDNMVGSRLVSRVEIARFGRRLERTDDYARGVGTQVKRLPIEKSGL